MNTHRGMIAGVEEASKIFHVKIDGDGGSDVSLKIPFKGNKGNKKERRKKKNKKNL